MLTLSDSWPQPKCSHLKRGSRQLSECSTTTVKSQSNGMTEVCISIKVFILKMEIWKWVRNWKLECLSWSTLQTQFGTEPRKTASSCQHLIFSLPKTKRIESSLPKTKGTEFNKNTFKEGCVGMRCKDYLCLLVETISDRATILVENMIWRVHNFKYGPYSRWQNFVTSAAEYEVHIWNCELARWCFMLHTLTDLIFVTNITNCIRGEKLSCGEISAFHV